MKDRIVINKSDKQNINRPISPQLSKSLEAFKAIYSFPTNQDIAIRELTISSLNKRAFLFFIKTITDVTTIDQDIIKPLLKNKEKDASIEQIIVTPSIKKEKLTKSVVEKINNGNAALFIQDDSQAYLIDCAKFKERGIERSENEIVIKGPKETFVEGVSTNISLIRKKIKNENLVFESTTISERAHDEVFIGYVKNLANDTLIKEVKKRLNKIDIDSLQNLAILEQYLEDRPRSIYPTILYTERPDRTCTFLERGCVVLLMNNSADALILPITFWDLFHSAEDEYLRFLNGNFTRFIRLIAFLITVHISAVYIAITTFHPEMIPTDLLLAISATKAKVPFTPIIEILLMEIAFELIREAGLRVPLPIGPTIGIVGALILGQAAVQANIVSPIVVIIVALGALSSFVIGDIGLNFSFRISRFIFIGLAYFFGLYGIVAVFMVLVIYLLSITSFGVPYLSPQTPSYLGSGQDTVHRKLLTKRYYRPKYFKPKDTTRS